MPIKRFLVAFAVLLAGSLSAENATAQHEIHHVPPVVSFDGYDPDLLHPYIEPLTFQHDWQFFKHADPEIFGDPHENTGWFATYDRLYLWVARPEDQMALSQSGVPITVADPTGGDFGWGNRFDIGYMTGEDHGWSMSFWHLDGPNVSDVLIQERINVFVEEEEDDDDDAVTVLRRDENDPVTEQRDFRLKNSINDSSLTSWELNKTFRLKRLHYGGLVEPLIGFRFAKFIDDFRRDQYQRFDEEGLIEIGPGAPPPDPTLGINERLTTDTSQFINHMVGGHLGFRWLHEKGRWDLSSEVKAFAFGNFQSFTRDREVETTIYSGDTLPDDPVGLDVTTVLVDRISEAENEQEFVVGTEIRAEAAYRVTRDVALRTGMNVLYFGRGIGRGDDLSRNDQSVTMVGATLGFTVNR